jgi:hypothetical protein
VTADTYTMAENDCHACELIARSHAAVD